MPVSRTANSNSCWVAVSLRLLTRTDTPPRWVNLMALPIRLVRIWRMRMGSPRTTGRTSGSTTARIARPLASAGLSSSRFTLSTNSRMLTLTDSRSSLPASALE